MNSVALVIFYELIFNLGRHPVKYHQHQEFSVVSHPYTIMAQYCLTSAVKRELVLTNIALLLAVTRTFFQ